MTVDELEERLRNEFPNIYKCVLINGDWGIGKTYFLKNKFLDDKDYIYVSLFGTNSIESFKTEIYSKFNKFIGKIKDITKRTEGNSIGLGPISLPITYWETDINKVINKKTKNKEITIIVDDLERKSREINIEDILGTIESMSEIKNVNIILVANEEKITEKEMFLNFKEKVIQKTYNVHKYSKDAPKEVTNYLLNNVKEKTNINIEDIKNTILEVFELHPVNNLRTLKKGINFVKLIVQYIDFKEVDIDEIKDIIIAALSIVIEKIECIYTENEEKTIKDSLDKLTYCIIKNYFKEQCFVSGKSTIVNLLLDIYQDKEVRINFERLNKYYKDLHTIDVAKEEIDLFYMSEEQLKEKIEFFYDNYVLNVDKKLDINNWFKKLNEIYTYAKVIGKENIFKEEEILKAMDTYLENLQVNEGLFYILDMHMPHQIRENKMLEYNKALNRKITEKYYSKSIEEIIKETKIGKFTVESLDRIFTIYTEDHTNFDKQKIINMMEENKYFIPDLNYEISYETWSWAHSIWKKARSYKQYRKDKSFEKCVNELLKHATVLGRYRIKSLNEQYGINMEE